MNSHTQTREEYLKRNFMANFWYARGDLKCSNINIVISGLINKLFDCAVDGFVVFNILNISLMWFEWLPVKDESTSGHNLPRHFADTFPIHMISDSRYIGYSWNHYTESFRISMTSSWHHNDVILIRTWILPLAKYSLSGWKSCTADMQYYSENMAANNRIFWLSLKNKCFEMMIWLMNYDSLFMSQIPQVNVSRNWNRSFALSVSIDILNSVH